MRILILTFVLWLILGSCPVSISSTALNVAVAKNFTQDFGPHQCRLWGIIAYSLPEAVVLNHLINASYSLKNLGASNYNGWGLAYYNGSEPIVMRGQLPASMDYNFTTAAQELARSGAHIGIGHVRLATSGATNIPDPHPFIRYKGGKWWAFGHNGWLSKATLKNLIGTEYLAENPPTVGDSWDDSDVIDSDLYMLYIIKCIEESGWNATQGIARAVTDISQADYGAMNFFLSDGETLWGFCKGNTLYYYYNETFPQYSVVASQPPNGIQDGWIALNDFNMVILTMDNSPAIIEDIRTIPEFPTNLILSLFILTTLVTVVLGRRRKSDYSITEVLFTYSIRVGRSVIEVTR
jgi:predicted glutamine amidotransferase